MRVTSSGSVEAARAALVALAVGSALGTLVSACPASLREGTYACDDGRCPSGWSCRADRRCYSSPEGVDAGAADAPRLDAPSSDAPTVDAPRPDAPIADAPTVDAPAASCGADGTTCALGTGGSGMCCGGACVDVTSDSGHCGDCTTRCAAPMTCVARTCRACTTSAHCDDGVGCTVDACAAGGVCTHDPDHSMCPLPSTPGTGPTDCLLAGLCTATGCTTTSRPDGTECRDRTARYFCACGGMCLDANSVCGGPSGPYSACATLSACEQSLCAAIGRTCT